MKTKEARPGLSRDTIKLIAVVTMTVNHIAIALMQNGPIYREIMIDTGYFTAITMCYFLVEGFEYTSSKKSYGGRLLVFALLSQIPFSVAFSEGLLYPRVNMVGTLFICFLIICAYRYIYNQPVKVLVIFMLFIFTGYCDWAYYAAVFTVVFCAAHDRGGHVIRAYIINMLIYASNKFLDGLALYSPGEDAMHVLGNLMGPIASMLVIAFFYNGERGWSNRRLSRWFFYLYYPAHLLLIGLIRIHLIHG